MYLTTCERNEHLLLVWIDELITAISTSEEEELRGVVSSIKDELKNLNKTITPLAETALKIIDYTIVSIGAAGIVVHAAMHGLSGNQIVGVFFATYLWASGRCYKSLLDSRIDGLENSKYFESSLELRRFKTIFKAIDQSNASQLDYEKRKKNWALALGDLFKGRVFIQNSYFRKREQLPEITSTLSSDSSGGDVDSPQPSSGETDE